MHGEAIGGTGAVSGSSACDGNCLLTAARRGYWQRRQRHTRRWCVLGFVLIPVIMGFLWLQFNTVRSSGGQMLYADSICGCRDTVAGWVSDFIWTQMIWMPCNMLVLLVWCALAFKLWGGRRRR